MSALDLTALATGITPDPDGYWTAAASPVSYPEGGNDECFAIEESSFWFRHRNRAILTLLQTFPFPSGPLLDVGGGNGVVTKAMQDAGFSAVLLEPGRGGVRNALARGVANVICGDVAGVGLRPRSFGAIGLFDVLEHLENDVAFLRALTPALRAGGRVYASVPAFQALWSNEDDEAGHFRRYRRPTLRAAMEAAGLRVDFLTYIFWPLPLPILLFRALPSRFGRRNEPSADRHRGEHEVESVLARKGLDAMLSPELALIRARRAIPFGASLLAVATV